jgi:hypothetical protein
MTTRWCLAIGGRPVVKTGKGLDLGDPSIPYPPGMCELDGRELFDAQKLFRKYNIDPRCCSVIRAN